MSDALFYQLFECLVVIVEVGILKYYLSSFFTTARGRFVTYLCFSVYAVISMTLSAFFPDVTLLTTTTVLSTLLITFFLYKGTAITKIFSVLLFLALMIGTEHFLLGIFQLFNYLDADIFQYRPARVVYVVTAKIVQAFFAIIIRIFTKRKDISASVGFGKMFPLLVCPLVSIFLLVQSVLSPIISNDRLDFPIVSLVIGILFINFVTLFFFENIKAAAEDRQQKVAAEIQLEEQIKYYQLLEVKQRETDAHWHDIQKHMKAMEKMLADGYQGDSESYLTELKDKIDAAPVAVRTPHPIVSAVLTNGLKRAKQGNIMVEMDVRLPNDIGISPVDLCVLIGNAFDNAIDACELLPEGSDRKISIMMNQKESTLLVEVKNAYDPAQKKPKNTKPHGIGLKNIETVVKRNGGFFNIEQGLDTFGISMVLNSPISDA